MNRHTRARLWAASDRLASYACLTFAALFGALLGLVLGLQF